MAVASETFWSTPVTANGTQDTFSFAFPVTAKAQVIPLFNGTPAPGGYTISMTDPDDFRAGGNVIFEHSGYDYRPANGVRVQIVRRLDVLQEAAFGVGFNRDTFTNAIDLLTMIAQQIAARAAMFPDAVVAGGFDPTLPDPADGTAGDILVLNSGKDGLEWGGTAYVGPAGPKGDPGDVSLSTLASHSNGQGASLIGIEDAGGKITATTVEGALAEHATLLAALDQAVILKGTWDASSGSFPGSGSAQAGWSYICSVSGTVNSVSFTAGDRIIAITDNASTSTYASNWFKADYTDQVSSVAGRTGAVTIAVSDLGNAILSAFVANSITGTITVSTSSPSGGSNGDIWLERAS